MTGEPQRVQGDSAQATDAQPSSTDGGFVRLYEDNFNFVWRTVRLLGVAADAADDAVQDVFLVAHRRLADFEARSAPRTWLFAIALRVVSDHRRSRRRRLRLLEQARTVERAPVATPYDHAASGQMRDALLRALDTLPEEQRVVFVMTELGDMSAPEIATALEVNLNTVYSRLRTARRELARRFPQLGGPRDA